MQAQPVEAQAETATQEGQARLPYLPGIDGLRALAVIAVLLYHAGLPFYGGFLGVDSFFVLSGFLITALLLVDWQNYGRVRLATFWRRRARRLLPALVVLLAGTLLLTSIVLPDELPYLTRDTLAAIGYVTNWYLIASAQSYFDAVERPSLLRHLWSLAVEEQFYIFWPLLFGVAMRFLKARGTLVLVLVGAIASVGLAAALYEPGADPSRVYYGTDTRVSAILIGAALAMVWAPGRAPALTHRRAGMALDVTGILALGGLLVAYSLLNDQHPLLYRGGLALVAVVTAVVVAVATHPSARFVPWLLERQPLRWIGLRSYSLYLWHWPIFMLTRPGIDVAYDGWGLQVIRFALAFALAALSYSIVELPIRHGALGRVWQALRRQAPAAAPANEPSQGDMGRAPAWYRRWTPAVATSVLVLGVTYVGMSVSQAAVRSRFASTTMLPDVVTAPLARVATPAATGATDMRTTSITATPLAATAVTNSTTDLTGTTETSQPTQVEGTSPATPAPTEAPTIDPALADELQRILDATIADGSIPGAVLSVRLPDGATWTGASGHANRKAGTAMTPETRVRIGSLSKMFTSVTVLQLIEEGALTLDAPVATWLPDLLPNGDIITVRQLLQHTSGLYDYLEDTRFVSQAYRDPERIWTPEELIAYATRFPPAFAPGAEGRWDYSSTNYVVLGMLVEQVTGNTLDGELRQRIFAPLGLNQSYSAPTDQVEGPQARGYSQGDDRTDVAMSFGFATANIVITADDLRRFGEAVFSDKLLKPATRELMLTFVDGKGQYNMPNLEYGLGVMRNRLPVGHGPDGQERPAEASTVLGHIGGFGGFRAALWTQPESGITIALSVNQSGTDPNDLATQVLDAILQSQGR